MTAQIAFGQRVDQIRELISSGDLTAIVLRRNPNLAWFIGGRSHVPSTIDSACLDVVVTREKVLVVTNVIEAPRLEAEELPNGIEILAIPWWENRDAQLPTGQNIGTDQPGGGRVDLGLEIEILRSSLSSFDVNRLEGISHDAAAALGEAMKSVLPEDRENDVAGKITQSLWSKDLEIVFLGVAGEHRAQFFRHPLPTTEPIGRRVIASICARRKGLIASVTRIVLFEPWNEQYESEYRGLLEIEHSMLDASVEGSPFSRPVQAATESYGRNGFDAHEWHRHHQGGPTGYLPRDWPATLTSERLIAHQQPLAWNPTGKGWKVEDTWLATGARPVLLSSDPNWPSRELGGRMRPEVLVR